MKVAFDQGLSATGVCVFRGNRSFQTKTFRPKEACANISDRRQSLVKQVTEWLTEIETFSDPIRCFLVEQFQAQYFKKKHRQKMGGAVAETQVSLIADVRKLERFSGYLIHALEQFRPGIPVLEINKGKTKKGEAEMLAPRFGINGSQHVRDAFHLGLLAGWLDG